MRTWRVRGEEMVARGAIEGAGGRRPIHELEQTLERIGLIE